MAAPLPLHDALPLPLQPCVEGPSQRLLSGAISAQLRLAADVRISARASATPTASRMHAGTYLVDSNLIGKPPHSASPWPRPRICLREEGTALY